MLSLPSLPQYVHLAHECMKHEDNVEIVSSASLITDLEVLGSPVSACVTQRVDAEFYSSSL